MTNAPGAHKSALNKKIATNGPTALIRLHFVEGARAKNISYYVKAPMSGGPQPLLGVAFKAQKLSLGSKTTPVPKRVTSYLRQIGEAKLLKKPIEVKWSKPIFSDALTILPKQFRIRVEPLLNTDPVLLSAFAIVASTYSDDVRKLCADEDFMKSIPDSSKELPFRSAGTIQLRHVAQTIASTHTEDTPDTPVNRLLVKLALDIHDFRLWNPKTCVAAKSTEWAEKWTILAAWDLWETLGMTKEERWVDLNRLRGQTGISHNASDAEALRKKCSRFGLHSKKLDIGRLRVFLEFP